MMRVLDGRDDLLEDLLCVSFRQLCGVNDIYTYLLAASDKIEEFATGGIFEDHEYLRLSVDELEQLDGVRIVESAQNLKFPLDFFENAILPNFLLVEDFDRNFVTGLLMKSH